MMTKRPAEPGERCTCGRPAVVMFLDSRFGDTGWCGRTDGGARDTADTEEEQVGKLDEILPDAAPHDDEACTGDEDCECPCAACRGARQPLHPGPSALTASREQMADRRTT